MKAVVIAAGKGIRLRPLTDEIPKCLAEVKGRPLLEWVLEKITGAGVEEVNLIVGYRRELIEDHFGPEFGGVKLNYLVQREQKGTAHALSLAEKFVGEKFLVANSDVLVSQANYKSLLAEDEFEKGDGFVLGRKVKDPWRFGVLKTDEMRVEGIVEKPLPGEEPSNIVSTGIYRFRKDFCESVRQTPLSERGEFELTDSLKHYISAGKKIGLKMCEGTCIDIEGKDDLIRADSMVEDLFPK